MEQVEEEAAGRGASTKTQVRYGDGLTEEQWLAAVDDSDDSIGHVTKRKQARFHEQRTDKAKCDGDVESSPMPDRASTERPEPCSSPFTNSLKRHRNATDNIASHFFQNASAPRINTDAYIYNAIKRLHPDVNVLDTGIGNCNITSYISATGDGNITHLTDTGQSVPSICSSSSRPSSLHWTIYVPPKRRLENDPGKIVEQTLFKKLLVTWKKHEFLIYIVDGRDGLMSRPPRQYIVTSDLSAAHNLLKTVGLWQNSLHNELWVFEGYWRKDSELYAAIQKSHWSDVILPQDLKEDLLKTILRFYDSRDTYAKLRVPWKRGLILYGPPGDGKTISIKATMKTLLDRQPSIPTLYVKSLYTTGNISAIFAQARATAPCYLVFEDIDSLITRDLRSFFLNTVDGVSENEGILMVASTNHIERLDPGLAKRPSRFDRKYLFGDPDLELRTKYCQYWQRKLQDNEDVEFPDKLCPAIAGLTDGFSFAYMQEAFISALLKIATDDKDKEGSSYSVEVIKTVTKTQSLVEQAKQIRQSGKKDNEADWDLIDKESEMASTSKDESNIIGEDKHGDDDDDLDKYILWRGIKLQIKNLRKELESREDTVAKQVTKRLAQRGHIIQD